MADRGGVVGIYLMPFLTDAAQPTGEDVIRHLEHAINVCGEDHVGIDSDQSISPISLTNEYRNQHRQFVMERQKLGITAPGEKADIYFYVPDYNTPARLELIGQQLSKRSHSSTRIEKILGANWLRLIGEVWG